MTQRPAHGRNRDWKPNLNYMPIPPNNVFGQDQQKKRRDAAAAVYNAAEEWRELKLGYDILTASIIEVLKKTYPENKEDMLEISLDDLNIKVTEHKENLEWLHSTASEEEKKLIRRKIIIYQEYERRLDEMCLASRYNWILEVLIRNCRRQYVEERKLYLRQLSQAKKGISKSKSRR